MLGKLAPRPKIIGAVYIGSVSIRVHLNSYHRPSFTRNFDLILSIARKPVLHRNKLF